MLSELWRLVEAHIPACLLNPAHRPGVERFTEGLPIEGHLGLEFHLHEPNRSPDLSQVFSVASANSLVSRHHGTDPAPQAAATLDCLRWLGSFPNAGETVRLLWLEWDAEAFDRPHPIPSVFLEPVEEAGGREWPTARHPEMGGHLLRLAEALPRDLLSRLSNDGVNVGIVGAMSSRNPAPHRLYLNGERLVDRLRALRRLGGPILDDAWVGRLAVLETDGIRIRPNFDILDGSIGDRLGLDLAWPGHSDLRLPPTLVRWLEEHRVADPDSIAALGVFPKVWTPLRDPWPDTYLLDSLTAPEDRFSQVTGYLHHLKLVFEERQLTGVKAYLGFAHQFVTPDAFGMPLDASRNPG